MAVKRGRGPGKEPLTGTDIRRDADIRLGRRRYFSGNAHLRLLFDQIAISEWISLYPRHAEDKEWLTQSRFTDEEEKTCLIPINIKFVKPINAYGVVQHCKDVENAAADWPATLPSPCWFLVGSDSTGTTEADLAFFKGAIGVDTLDLPLLPKNAIVGAFLLEKLSPDDGRRASKWMWSGPEGTLTHAFGILGSLRWKFDENGPSALFKDLDDHQNVLLDDHQNVLQFGTSLSRQEFASERLEAVRKKLLKAKYVTVLHPGTGRPSAVFARPTIRAKRKRFMNPSASMKN